jgi:hypothetical protein
VLPFHVPSGLGLPALGGDVGGQARGEKEREGSGRVLARATRGGVT